MGVTKKKKLSNVGDFHSEGSFRKEKGSQKCLLVNQWYDFIFFFFPSANVRVVVGLRPCGCGVFLSE